MKSVEGSSDGLWYLILSRLSSESLIVSKCVCKAWCDFGSHILAHRQKRPLLHACGVLFEVGDFPRNHAADALGSMSASASYLMYVSLMDKNVVSLIHDDGRNIVNYGFNEQFLGNLSVDLNLLYTKPCSTHKDVLFYAAHKGLILTLHSDATYRVVNPATQQVLKLPKHSSDTEFFSAMGVEWRYKHAIVNLSCSLSSSVGCSFMVMRFYNPHKLVDIYHSEKREWVQCEFSLEGEWLFNTSWYLTNSVFLSETQTFYTLTSEGKGVALEFESLDEPKICASYYFSLPKVVRCGYSRMATLGECQGCLYLSYAERGEKEGAGIWIWKHSGVSSANPWIPIFEISKSKTTILRKPDEVGEEEHILKYFDVGRSVSLVGFHPEAEVVFIYVSPNLIFTYDFANDILERICVLGDRKLLLEGLSQAYTPCLARIIP